MNVVCKPKCEGLLKSPKGTEMPKEGENKVAFTNYQLHEQMKAPFVICDNFESLVRKIQGCEPPKDGSFTVKMEMHDACGFAYTIVRSDGEAYGPALNRGVDAVYVFLACQHLEERKKNKRWYCKQKAAFDVSRRLAKAQKRNRLPYLQLKFV